MLHKIQREQIKILVEAVILVEQAEFNSSQVYLSRAKPTRLANWV